MNKIFVNLIDLISPSETITHFVSEADLRKYTNVTKKYFPLGVAKTGGFLKLLLRRIDPPKRKGQKKGDHGGIKGRRRHRRKQ
jgi:hypothetical protein